MHTIAAYPIPLNDLSLGARLISEISGRSQEEVLDRLEKEHCSLGFNVLTALKEREVSPFVLSEKLQSFYSDTDAFLYETFVWNRCSLKQDMRQRVLAGLRRWLPFHAKVLVFGDGMGFDCASLALSGYRVTYFEIGNKSIEFARRIFSLNNVSVDVCSDLSESPADFFDAVVCLDVLEHVEDPPRVVGELVKHLRSEGLFFSHAPFAYLHASVSTHLRKNLRWSGDWRCLYGTSGLIPIDGAFFWNPIIMQKSAVDPSHRQRSIYPKMPLFLQVGGLLLSLSRLWNFPYSFLCCRLVQQQARKLPRLSPPVS